MTTWAETLLFDGWDELDVRGPNGVLEAEGTNGLSSRSAGPLGRPHRLVILAASGTRR
ncbi:MAG TPA: hypothetical protein VMK12_09510 [Anaeromyxobacteraceae bacterium]|nr:hypothetical protein [Anaeromyxobacteraceae bacterium]